MNYITLHVTQTIFRPHTQYSYRTAKSRHMLGACLLLTSIVIVRNRHSVKRNVSLERYTIKMPHRNTEIWTQRAFSLHLYSFSWPRRMEYKLLRNLKQIETAKKLYFDFMQRVQNFEYLYV